jgi:hypothetical protein
MNVTQMPTSIFQVLLLGLTIGCDAGRLGMYKLSLQSQRSCDTATHVVVGDEEKLRQVIRETLNSKGFEERPSRPGRWHKNGVWIELMRNAQGELVLKVWAFGGKRERRLCEGLERELLVVLRQQPGLEITPAAPTPAN